MKIKGTIQCHRCKINNQFYDKPFKSVYCVCGCGLEIENYHLIETPAWLEGKQ